jgi:hypothetical protein
MKTKKTPQAESAAVADFAIYRNRRIANEQQEAGSPEGQNARIAATKIEATTQLERLASPAIAFASVYLSADGSITLAASGIEPEFSPAIASALLTLRRRIQAHQPKSVAAPKGSATPAILLSIAFAAATYFNQLAWLDATLSVAGHLVVGWLLDREKYRR